MSHRRRGISGLFARLGSYFPDHELHIRSGGKLRFIRISSALQVKVVVVAAVALTAWLAFTLVMVGMQIMTANERVSLETRERQVNESAARIATYHETVEEQIARVARRQEMLDALVGRHFGNLEYDAENEAVAEDGVPLREADELSRLESRQLEFARALRQAVEQRTEETAEAIRDFGLDPRMLSRQAMGGPLIPVHSRAVQTAGTIDAEIASLEMALNRLAVMELSLRAIPSSRPTELAAMTSPFGVRSDPFTGSRAMHAGIDFRGRHGQGILAAGGGRVSFAGRRGGYGNVVEIDHGAGVVTRYAHLSGIEVRPGERVRRGERIGRMGSTGRSTATHLHYEVRVNGRAVNPRPLLEADRNVLEIQSVAERRNVDSNQLG